MRRPWPTLFAQRTDVAAGVDAVAGGCIFREAVTEVDATEKRFGIHDSFGVANEGDACILHPDEYREWPRPVAVSA